MANHLPISSPSAKHPFSLSLSDVASYAHFHRQFVINLTYLYLPGFTCALREKGCGFEDGERTSEQISSANHTFHMCASLTSSQDQAPFASSPKIKELVANGGRIVQHTTRQKPFTVYWRPIDIASLRPEHAQPIRSGFDCVARARRVFLGNSSKSTSNTNNVATAIKSTESI